MVPESSAARRLLEETFAHALKAAAPSVCLPSLLARLDNAGPAVVLGTGKAAASMALAFRSAWSEPLRGMVVTRYGHGLRAGEDAGPIEVLEASHPSPNEWSVRAGRRLLELAASMRPNETLYFLASGGGSSLSAVPLPGISLAQKRAAADFLICAGAGIGTVNCVRKHLSALKGGRLAAAAHPARVVTIVISDVTGDDLADVASGPTIADRSTQAQAKAILEEFRYPGIADLEPVLTDVRFETPKPGAAAFQADRVELAAASATALSAAREYLSERGFRCVVLGDDLDGIARELGREHARLAKQFAGSKVAILSGGETRVVLGERRGKGGRNLEYLAGLALELADESSVFALAADTDGIDGDGDHAGGMVVPEILELGASRGLDLEAALASSNTYRYFDACELLVKTGPTRTNVNDFRLILCQS